MDKENMHPNSLKSQKGNKLRSSQQELRDLIKVIKQAKKTNESFSKNNSMSTKNLQDSKTVL